MADTNEPRLMLTPLRSGHNFKRATNAGRWEAISGTLGELGAALDVDATAPVDPVRATPDPWSQARSFSDAVLGSTPDPRIIGQWRGLLALFALSELYGDRYRLDYLPVELGSSSTRFAQVMRQLLPTAALPVPSTELSQGWDRPILLRVVTGQGPTARSTTVGMLNPACLVAGGRDLDRIRIDAVPWMRDGLKDPARLTGRESLSPAALRILEAYVQRLKGALAELCAGAGAGPEQTFARAVRQQLDAFASDCLDPAIHPGVVDHVFAFDPVQQHGDDLPSLYQLLTAVQKVREPEPGTSDCLLALRNDLLGQMPFRALVLLDPSIATPERPPNLITFWGLQTLDQVLSAGREARSALAARMAESGYLMIEPDDLFTRVLVQLDDPEQPGRIEAHPDSMRDALLPLSPLALLLKSPQKLVETVSLNRDGRVSMDVLLSGRVHRLSRRYVDRPAVGQGRLVREADWGLGDVALWPNFVSDTWSRYCARIDYAANSLGRLRGRFAMSGKLLARLLSADGAISERLHRWGSGDPVAAQGGTSAFDGIQEFAGRGLSIDDLVRFRATNSGGRVSEIQISRLPFEAVFFTLAADADGGAQPAGLAVVAPIVVPTSEQHRRSAAVAIDFGTTNTVACLDSPEPMRLEGRILHPIRSAKSGQTVRSVELAQKLRDFMPAEDRDLPTPTVVINRSLDAEGRDFLDGSDALDDVLLVRELMYFQPDFAEDGTIAAVPLRDWSVLLNSIKYDLKWSPAQEMRDAARRFIRQLMTMIAAEWARRGGDPAKLRWYFSRPRDMGDNADFVDQMRRALLDVVPGADRNAIRPLQYEGDAAAEYILDERTKGSGTKGALNIILDIGGGTTDIAVWSGGAEPKRLHSASLRIAGGDFFTSHIMANPDILSDFGLRTWANVVQQLGQENDASLKANINYIGELLFSGRTLDDAIERSWSRVSGTDRVKRLKETSFTYLGGVAWIVGRQLRELIRSGVIDKSALQDIAVAFCGRGAGLFKRLHGDDPRAQTDISRLLLLIAVAAGEGRPLFPQVQISKHPKIEVAAGMILLAERDMSAQQPELAVGNGDSGLVFDIEDAVEAAVDQPVESREAGYTPNPVLIGIEDLPLFLKSFAKVAGFELIVSDHQRAKIVNGVADIDRDDNRAGRGTQSEFAAVLKVLVGMMRARPGDAVRPSTVWK